MAKEGAARKVEVTIPEELVELLGAPGANLSREVLEIVLVDLFRRAEISSGYAARILGIHRVEFWDILAKYKVPLIDYEPGELKAELEAARRVLDEK